MSGNPASVNAIATLPKTLDPRLRGDDADMWSFPRKREPSGVRYAPATFQKHWIPACAGMTRLFPIAATLRVLLLDIRVTCCGLAATCRLGDRRCDSPRPAFATM